MEDTEYTDLEKKILLKLGKEVAKESDLDEDMDEQELIDLCFEVAIDEGQTVRSMSWRAGSGAGITKWKGYFWGWDDVGVYGPFTSFGGAESGEPPSFWGFDEIIEDWTHEDYRADEEEE